MAKFNWGVLGPGNIAVRFTNDLKRLSDATLLAAGSRSWTRRKPLPGGRALSELMATTRNCCGTGM